MSDQITARAISFQSKLAVASGFVSSINSTRAAFAVSSAAFAGFQRQAQQIADIAKSFMKQFEKTIEAIRALIQAVTWPIITSLHRHPLIYVSPPRPKQAEKRLDRHLDTDVDRYGFFIIGGKSLRRLHSTESRTGKFLHRLLVKRSEMVEYEDLVRAMGAGDRIKTFKDLKHALKHEGFELDYVLVRGKGIALKGILAI